MPEVWRHRLRESCSWARQNLGLSKAYLLTKSNVNGIHDEIQLTDYANDLHTADTLLGLPRGERNHAIDGGFARRPAKRRPRWRYGRGSRNRQQELGKTELHGRDANGGPQGADATKIRVDSSDRAGSR